MYVPYGMQGHYPQQPQQQPTQNYGQPQQQPYPQQYQQQQQQQPYPQQYQQQQQQPPHSLMPPSSWGQVRLQHVGLPFANAITITRSGLPTPLAFAMALIAVAIALVCDVVFLHVRVPGVGGYAWYLTTALSFMGAGYGSMMWTRAGKTTSFVAVGIAAVLYGACDLGLGLFLSSLTLNGAITLAAQGVAIGFFTGFGGVYKALRARND